LSYGDASGLAFYTVACRKPPHGCRAQIAQWRKNNHKSCAKGNGGGRACEQECRVDADAKQVVEKVGAALSA